MNIVSLYYLPIEHEEQSLSMPKGSRILSVCVKHELLYVSVEQDVNAGLLENLKERENVTFAVIREGRHFYVDDFTFLGTVVLEYGNTIFNVFYRKERNE